METALGIRLWRSQQRRTQAGLSSPRPQSILTDFPLESQGCRHPLLCPSTNVAVL